MHVAAMYATKRRRRNSKTVRTVTKETHTKSNPSKRHRERLNQELDTLANLLPFEHSVLSKLDKLSILRLSVSYLRTKSYFQAALSGSQLLAPANSHRQLQHHQNNSNNNGGAAAANHLHSQHHRQQYLTGNGQQHPFKQEPKQGLACANSLSQTSQPTVPYPAELRVEGDLIVQALNGFLLILTCDGEVFYTSHTVETYLGFHQSDICHQSVYELVHSEDREELMQQLKWNSAISPCSSLSSNGQLEGPNGKSIQEILASRKSHQNAEHRNLLERNFTVRFRCLLDNTSGFLRLDVRGRIKVLHGQQNQMNLANSANNLIGNSNGNGKQSASDASGGSAREPLLAFFGVCIPFGPPSLHDMPGEESYFTSEHRLDMSFLNLDARGRQLLGLTAEDLAPLAATSNNNNHGNSTSSGCATAAVGAQAGSALPICAKPARGRKSNQTSSGDLESVASGDTKATLAINAATTTTPNTPSTLANTTSTTNNNTCSTHSSSCAKKSTLSVYDLVHHDDLNYIASAHQELLKTGASGLIAYRLMVRRARSGSSPVQASSSQQTNQTNNNNSKQASQPEPQYQWLQTSAKLEYKHSKPDYISCTHRPLVEEEGRDLLGKRTMDFKVTYLDVGFPSKLATSHEQPVARRQQAASKAPLTRSPSLSGSSRSLASSSPQSSVTNESASDTCKRVTQQHQIYQHQQQLQQYHGYKTSTSSTSDLTTTSQTSYNGTTINNGHSHYTSNYVQGSDITDGANYHAIAMAATNQTTATQPYEQVYHDLDSNYTAGRKGSIGGSKRKQTTTDGTATSCATNNKHLAQTGSNSKRPRASDATGQQDNELAGANITAAANQMDNGHDLSYHQHYATSHHQQHNQDPASLVASDPSYAAMHYGGAYAAAAAVAATQQQHHQHSAHQLQHHQHYSSSYNTTSSNISPVSNNQQASYSTATAYSQQTAALGHQQQQQVDQTTSMYHHQHPYATTAGYHNMTQHHQQHAQQQQHPSSNFLPTEHLLHHYHSRGAAAAALASWPSAASEYNVVAGHNELQAGATNEAASVAAAAAAAAMAATDLAISSSQQTTDGYQTTSLDTSDLAKATGASLAAAARNYSVGSATHQLALPILTGASQCKTPASLGSDAHRSPLSSGDSSNSNGSAATTAQSNSAASSVATAAAAATAAMISPSSYYSGLTEHHAQSHTQQQHYQHQHLYGSHHQHQQSAYQTDHHHQQQHHQHQSHSSQLHHSPQQQQQQQQQQHYQDQASGWHQHQQHQHQVQQHQQQSYLHHQSNDNSATDHYFGASSGGSAASHLASSHQHHQYQYHAHHHSQQQVAAVALAAGAAAAAATNPIKLYGASNDQSQQNQFQQNLVQHHQYHTERAARVAVASSGHHNIDTNYQQSSTWRAHDAGNYMLFEPVGHGACDLSQTEAQDKDSLSSSAVPTDKPTEILTQQREEAREAYESQPKKVSPSEDASNCQNPDSNSSTTSTSTSGEEDELTSSSSESSDSSNGIGGADKGAHAPEDPLAELILSTIGDIVLTIAPSSGDDDQDKDNRKP